MHGAGARAGGRDLPDRRGRGLRARQPRPVRAASVLAAGSSGCAAASRSWAPRLHKHAFDLRTGRCLDDDSVAVPAYDVRVEEGVVLVGGRRRAVA